MAASVVGIGKLDKLASGTIQSTCTGNFRASWLRCGRGVVDGKWRWARGESETKKFPGIQSAVGTRPMGQTTLVGRMGKTGGLSEAGQLIDPASRR